MMLDYEGISAQCLQTLKPSSPIKASVACLPPRKLKSTLSFFWCGLKLYLESESMQKNSLSWALGHLFCLPFGVLVGLTCS